MITKVEEKQYSFSKTYQIVNNGKWEVKTKPDNVQFIHTLKDKNYSYEYTKTVQLVKGKPVMILRHTIRNTGVKTIQTIVYDHNFFVMDNQPVGPGYTAQFPFNISGVFTGAKIVDMQGNRLLLTRDLAKGESFHCAGLQGFSQDVKDYDIRIENHTIGAGVRITCDHPLEKVVFWSCPTAFCPEPYVSIKAEPGKEFSWDITYEFYNCEVKSGLVK
jgi:hypothetical protein